MSDIFISYRREDSEDVTGRIYDHLCAAFGKERIFTDVDDIPLGVDFREHIDREVSHCQVLLAVIGPDWLEAGNDQNQRRLDDPADFVRIEIESALQRGIPIVPVLVRRAGMPREEALPDILKPLAFRNAVPVRANPDFNNDVVRLIHGLEQHLAGIPGEQQSAEPKADERSLAEIRAAIPRVEEEPAVEERAEETPANDPQPEVTPSTHVSDEAQISGNRLDPAESTPSVQRASGPPAIGKMGLLGIVAVAILGALVYGLISWQSEIESPFRDTLASGDSGPEMIVIPAGTFVMGSPEKEQGRQAVEGPQHEVRVQSFALGKFEVTFDEYDRFAGATGRALPDDAGWGRGNRPVINVSWNDAVAYADWLGEQTGHRYRLPTEAEWEYAARAGTTTRYSWGDEIDCGRARYGSSLDKCAKQRSIVPVGSFAANPFGLYDLHGNVWEWTRDCWHDTYASAPTDGGAWLEADFGDCTWRVLRGGSWYNVGDALRSARRVRSTADDADVYQGFRLARDL